MECKAIEKKLIFYLEGDLSDKEMQIISSHIEICEGCSAKLNFIKESMQSIEIEKEREAMPFLYTRIQGKMQQTEAKKTRWVLAPLAIASVLALGLLIGTLIVNITQVKNQNISVASYDVSEIFNDEQMESSAYRLLNN